MPEAPKQAAIVIWFDTALSASEGLTLKVFSVLKVILNKPPPAPSSTISEVIGIGVLPSNALNKPTGIVPPTSIPKSISGK